MKAIVRVAQLLLLCLLSVAGAGFSGFPLAVHPAYGIPVSTAASLLAVALGIALLRQPLPDRTPAPTTPPVSLG